MLVYIYVHTYRISTQTYVRTILQKKYFVLLCRVPLVESLPIPTVISNPAADGPILLSRC
jgi:hypothetical protein